MSWRATLRKEPADVRGHTPRCRCSPATERRVPRGSLNADVARRCVAARGAGAEYDQAYSRSARGRPVSAPRQQWPVYEAQHRYAKGLAPCRQVEDALLRSRPGVRHTRGRVPRPDLADPWGECYMQPSCLRGDACFISSAKSAGSTFTLWTARSVTSTTSCSTTTGRFVISWWTRRTGSADDECWSLHRWSPAWIRRKSGSRCR